ncbi:Uncharacterized protein FKW44_020264, partial [Caligus rogercresseyi]
EFSRSLSFRRPRHTSHRQRKRIKPLDSTEDEDVEGERSDTLGEIGPLLPHISVGISHRRDIEYPPGFSFKQRPSV